jgi:hypothetical protein
MEPRHLVTYQGIGILSQALRRNISRRDAETQREKIHSPLCVSAPLRENPSLT